MGKKGFNWKARRVQETKIDNTETGKIQVDIPVKEYGAEDTCNMLVLPSSKRSTKIKKDDAKNMRILTKKQRRNLEKIVEKKTKKENRATLLEKLAQVQISPEELLKMTSIASVQSKGLKKKLQNKKIDSNDMIESISAPTPTPVCQTKKINSISGSRKRKYLLSLEGKTKKKEKRDLNVVGLDISSSDSETEDVDETNDVEVKQEVVNETDTDLLAKTDNEIVEPTNTVEMIEISDSEHKTDPTQKKKRTRKNNSKPKQKEKDADKIKLPKKETTFISVQRDPKLQIERLKLPIVAEEQMVVETINENAVVIIAGETGSGKTTQVPQFLYESGYTQNGKTIGITEPRRVAAVAMSIRVGAEMNLSNRDVSYLMRYEGNVTEDTKIKFMTDGVLLKEIETDFMLTKYSVIIIDEAHERSVFTDILIGLLSRIVPLRCKKNDPLRLVIMSATLRIEDFTENTRLFKYPPPVIKIDVRQFPVTVHFNKRTQDDYLKAAFSKTLKIHTKLPEGGILIFVTGQQEVNLLVKRLRQAFPYKNNKEKTNKSNKKKKIKDPNLSQKKTEEPPKSSLVKSEDLSTDDEPNMSEEDDLEMMFSLKKVKKTLKERKKVKTPVLPKVNLDDFEMPDEEIRDQFLENGEDDLDPNNSDDDEWDLLAANVVNNAAGPLWVLPLYSMLPPSEQSKVFEPAPEGCRLCVVATNVAETSLTIPDIKYVVDTGKQKIRMYERVTGASAMRVVWTSQASAEQRAGRAGRVAPGHCYRLYSSAVYQHDFPKDKDADIRLRPIDDLMLQMKCMGIDKVVNFPFPSAPDILQLKSAEIRLETLGALERPQSAAGINLTEFTNDNYTLKVTPLGRAIAGYPVSPRYGKMLALSHQHNLFQYTLCMVAALSVQEIFIGQKRKWLAFGENLLLGDPGMLLNIVGAAEHAALSGTDMESWCNSQGIRWRALREIRLLKGQLAGEKGIPSAPKEPPGPLARPLRQILLAGLGDCVAKRMPLEDFKEAQDKLKYKYAYNCANMEEPVFIHSASVLRKELPEWVVYQEIYESGEGDDAKMIMRCVTAIEPEWLPIYVPKLCNLGEPLVDPSPRYDKVKDKMFCHVNATFGRSGWELPKTEIPFPKTSDVYRWFAVNVLDGTVFEELQKYSKSLLSPPTAMIKSWAKLQPRTETFYRALFLKEISNKASLLEEWKSNPYYLLEEYKKWLPESAHSQVSVSWPPKK